MSADQMSALVAAAAADPTIAGELAQATTADDLVAIAARLGFDVTVAEVEAAGTAVTSDSLSDAELAGVSGGGSPSLDPMLCPTGHCQSLYGLGCG